MRSKDYNNFLNEKIFETQNYMIVWLNRAFRINIDSYFIDMIVSKCSSNFIINPECKCWQL